ncbi:methyl-accepting chemotaxis protein [Hoeflea halophila]|uniref:Methyl-accepting chemotaxis protein n=1 Tax=Hoeflea halophila TaxID=714899 RepID=A0A286HLT5_9HYPH|nr:methyl-accepting chemotaxis protein [Hoeflea halophila]SOE08731.1 methyl-accepting chemotaxis protein [Hoeflea halophila]
MGFNLAKGLAAKVGGSSRSITQKIAITVILINLFGLAVTSFVISQMSGASQMEMAERNWLKDTAQIGSQAAGGVKWGKVDAIRSAYEVFRNDPKLALVGMAAFNQAGEQVDIWTRSETPNPSLAQVLGSDPGELAQARLEESADTVVISAPLPAGKDGVSLGQIKTVWSTADIAMSAREFALKALVSQVAVLIVAVTILLFAMRKFVGRPLADVNRRIGELQAGDITAPIPHADKGDEIGVVSRALTVFCEAAQMKLDADAQMVRQREQLDAERQANMSETERSSLVQRKVVEELGAALEKLASGDLTARVPDLGGEFAALQDNFNRALSALEQTVGTIDSAQHAVKQASDSLGASTDELARRTEQQAAALEQTAAALDEITSTVKGSSEQATEAGDLVGSTRDAATSSSEVVRSAITAMGGIEESSSRIAQILKVIDDIAFQTNLLALNAGVEAARAGEAGKGFAVVAQEVRDLAGRSANAAKEIKVLIEESGTQVSNGVDLVNRTGQSIEQIEKQIVEVALKIDAISRASREQSTGLSQVNTAISQMDTMTQKNAAMVQDSNASSQKLAGECQRLADVVTSFKLTAPASHARATQSAPLPETRQTPAPRVVAQPQYQTRGNAALARSTDSWEEF